MKEGGVRESPNRSWTTQPNRWCTMDWNANAPRLLGKRAIYLQADGPFALVTPCRTRACALWPTRADAEHAMNGATLCGDDCHGVSLLYIT